MSAVIGERDKVLRATVPRNLNPSLGKSLSVDVDPPAFHQNSAGIPTIPSATFTATPNGFVGQVLWSITSGGKLTGTTPNERTLLFSDMTSDTVKVTATIVYDGQAYIAVKTFYKLTDGAPGKDGKDANPEDLSPAALAAILEGQITESQLAHDLASRIDLVDGPASNPATVQGRVKAETDARVAAIAQEAADRVTYVQQYTYSEQEIDNSLSVFATTITSQYKAYADGVSGAAVSQSTAYVQNYAYSKSATDSALSAMANTLRSEFATNDGVTTGYLNQYYYTQAQTNSAISSATTTLSTTVNQHTTTLQTQAQSIDGLSAQYTVKIDNNGYVTGFGIASTVNNGAPSSAFIVNAGAFSVVAPGGAPQPMFTVGQVSGKTVAVLRGDLIAENSIVQSKLVVGGSPDNIIPDPKFRDLTWWDRALPKGSAAQWADAGTATGWKDGTSLYLGISSVELTTDSQYFELTAGATYLIEGQAGITNDWNGRLSVWFYIQGWSWWPMINPVSFPYATGPQLGLGQNWNDGLPVLWNSTCPKGLSTWTSIVTIPASGSVANFVPRGMIRIRNSHTTGSCEIGGLSITRVSDSVLIKDGAITAQKIQVNSLQAISNIVTARVGGSGAGIDQDQNGIRIYAPNGMRVVQLGNLDV